MGYLAPELASWTGKATIATDVYAFRAFLLEVACRRSVEPDAQGEQLVLVDWVLESWQRGSVIQTRDPRLGEEYSRDEMELVLKLGLLCLHPMPTARPSMRQVMQFLDRDVALPELSPAHLSFSILPVFQKEEFNDYCNTSCPSSMATASVLSGGR